jgi:hypothetical protein
MKKIKLDKEEQQILASFERGEWRPARNLKQEIARHRQCARNTRRTPDRTPDGIVPPL